MYTQGMMEFIIGKKQTKLKSKYGNRKCCAKSQNLKLLFNAPMFSFMYTVNMKKFIIETKIIIWWIILKCYLYFIRVFNLPTMIKAYFFTIHDIDDAYYFSIYAISIMSRMDHSKHIQSADLLKKND
jgi:hypothetical protein